MTMTEDRFEFLLAKFKADNLTQAEWEELRNAINDGKYDLRLKEDFLNILQSGEKHPSWTSELQENIWQEILNRRQVENVHPFLPNEKETEKGDVLFLHKRRIIQYAAIAASLILFFTPFWLIRSNNKPVTKTAIAKHAAEPTDIAPGSNKAILILANGSRIILDSATNGLIANQSGAKILKFNGQLTVSPEKGMKEKLFDSSHLAYNIISTPRGGQYQLILPDGSKVWLNSASSLKFPSAFYGKERRVELTGEGYFEVAKNANMPFSVTVNQMKIAVLGTHFNIMAYDDEKTMNTTLLEGSVTVSDAGMEKKLLPGQQAIVNIATQKVSVGQADISKAIAWKNGLFEFDNTDLSTIMRQLARWYDIEVVYDVTPEKTALGGSISRNLSLKDVLNMLEANGINHFKIEEKKIVVLP